MPADETSSDRDAAPDTDPALDHDAGMNKETRCNTVELDLMAIRAIAKAAQVGRGTAQDDEPAQEEKRGEVQTAPEHASDGGPKGPSPETPKRTAMVATEATAVTVATAAATATTSAEGRPPKPVVTVHAAKTLEVIFAHKPRRDPNDRRALLGVACACLAVLLVVAWRVVVSPLPGSPSPQHATAANVLPVMKLPPSAIAAPAPSVMATSAPSASPTAEPPDPSPPGAGSAAAPSAAPRKPPPVLVLLPPDRPATSAKPAAPGAPILFNE